MQAHLIWDWNGTLLDDQEMVLAATNESFARLHFPDAKDSVLDEIYPGVPPLTPTCYRELFQRPLKAFYHSVTGRNISDSEFQLWTELYLDAYRRRALHARLNRGARAALAEWRKFGGSQSLLSLWEHENLIQRVQQLGLAPYFTRIDGRIDMRANHSDGKHIPLRNHLRHLLDNDSPQISSAIEAGRVILIGDTIDDISAAYSAGVMCIFFTNGIPGYMRPEIGNAPTAITLHDAVDLAKILASQHV